MLLYLDLLGISSLIMVSEVQCEECSIIELMEGEYCISCSDDQSDGKMIIPV